MHLVLLGLLDESVIHLVSFKNVHTNISINVGPINAYVLALAAAEKGKKHRINRTHATYLTINYGGQIG